MLTTKIIQEEINGLISRGDEIRRIGFDNIEDGQKEYDKAERRVKFLNSCLFYLEKSPTEIFITQQLEKLMTKRFKIMDGYKEWLEYQPKNYDKTDSEWKAEYNQQMETTKLNKQIKLLKFILS